MRISQVKCLKGSCVSTFQYSCRHVPMNCAYGFNVYAMPLKALQTLAWGSFVQDLRAEREPVKQPERRRALGTGSSDVDHDKCVSDSLGVILPRIIILHHLIFFLSLFFPETLQKDVMSSWSTLRVRAGIFSRTFMKLSRVQAMCCPRFKFTD